MDDISIELYSFRIVDDDTLAQARRNSRIRNTLDTFFGIIELDRRLIGWLLRATPEGDIVHVDLTNVVRFVVNWLLEVSDENLAAVWARLGGKKICIITIWGSDCYIAAEKEDFSAHIHTAIAFCIWLLWTKVIAFEWLFQDH